jgi:hypothetical protein
MLSDTHNPVCLSLSLNKFVNKQVDFLTHANDVSKCTKAYLRPKWESSKEKCFLENIDKEKINVILNKLSHLDSIDNVDLTSIDNVMSGVCDIFHESAIECGFVKKGSVTMKRYKPMVYKRKLPSKPWFNKKCEEKK